MKMKKQCGLSILRGAVAAIMGSIVLFAQVIVHASGLDFYGDFGTETAILEQYKDYEKRLGAVAHMDELEKYGFDTIEEHSFPVLLESFAEEELTFIPAMEKTSHRVALFLADEKGDIVYRTDQLETNYLYKGIMEQPTKDIAAVSFQDANQDGLTDIVLITKCVNDTGAYAGKVYKTGDVLFQSRGDFVRDYRISEKINRFSMNKSINCIMAFVRDGQSVEFLYTATTLDELLQQGFRIIEEQCYKRNFEKLGRLCMVPGTVSLAGYNIFMVYLVDEQGNIVWSCQPMEDYDNLYSLKGMTGKDVDGDGLKDLVILARYSYEGPEGELKVESDCAIYYQRTSGFDMDTCFEDYYQCTEETKLEKLIAEIRAYWGWKVETND